MVQLKLTCGRLHSVFKPGFHMVVTVVEIESRSFRLISRNQRRRNIDNWGGGGRYSYIRVHRL